MLSSTRLRIYPASRSQMEAMIASEPDGALRAAYMEMLDGCLRHPDQWDWYAVWIIELMDGTRVGNLCFKGLDADGVAEIGYGISDEYQGQGYATEAVQAVTAWAFRDQRVKAVEAETTVENIASQRVLEKCGFQPTGKTGQEGPRYALRIQ